MVQISSAIKGRVSILDSAEEPEQLSQFLQRFKEGQPIQCRVSQVVQAENLVQLLLQDHVSTAACLHAPASVVVVNLFVIDRTSLLCCSACLRNTTDNMALSVCKQVWYKMKTQHVCMFWSLHMTHVALYCNNPVTALLVRPIIDTCCSCYDGSV